MQTKTLCRENVKSYPNPLRYWDHKSAPAPKNETCFSGSSRVKSDSYQRAIFHNFQSLEIIRNMYQYTEAFCHYSWNSSQEKKSCHLNFTYLEKNRKIWKIEKSREKNVEIIEKSSPTRMKKAQRTNTKKNSPWRPAPRDRAFAGVFGFGTSCLHPEECTFVIWKIVDKLSSMDPKTFVFMLQ